MEDQVAEFMRHVGAPRPSPIDKNKSGVAPAWLLTVRENLRSLAEECHVDAIVSMEKHEDVRLMRLHLILEELAEVCDAMYLPSRDEVDLLDGLCDLAYVVVGTAVAFDLPFEEGFDAVHKSNMTKDGYAAVRHDGTRGKGEQYRPPNLEAVMRRHDVRRRQRSAIGGIK